MPVVGIECIKFDKQLDFEGCLMCHEPCAPAPLRQGIFDNIQDRGRNISPSLLTRPCLLSAFLSATNNIYLPLERLYQPNYGTAHHFFYAKYVPKHDLSERKVKSKQLGLTGTLDHFESNALEIIDLKSTANIGTKNKPSEEHSWQVNLYGYMLEEEDVEVEKLSVLYTDPKRWLWLPVEKKSRGEVEAWAKPKIELLNLAFDGKTEIQPNPCWMCNQQNRDRKIYCETYNMCVFNREKGAIKK